MIAALVACILVLGFNYWMSSSRNIELQSKLYELEAQVRRIAVERGAVELKKNEFEDEIQKQKQQIVHIEDVYQRKLEEKQDTCSQDKVTMQQNISYSTKTIQELKDQLNQLNSNYERLENDLQSCQSSIDTVNTKLTYEIAHCRSQVVSQKAICDERVAAAKLDTHNMEKLIFPPEEDAAKKDENPSQILLDRGNGTSYPLEQKENGIDVNASKDLVPTKDFSDKQDTLQPQEGGKPEDNNLTEDREMDGINAREDDEDDPGMESMLIQGKADDTHIDDKIEDPEEYDGDELAVGRVDLEKQRAGEGAEKTDKEMEDETADYNGDDENEGELEADKQAELSHI